MQAGFGAKSKVYLAHSCIVCLVREVYIIPCWFGRAGVHRTPSRERGLPCRRHSSNRLARAAGPSPSGHKRREKSYEKQTVPTDGSCGCLRSRSFGRFVHGYPCRGGVYTAASSAAGVWGELCRRHRGWAGRHLCRFPLRPDQCKVGLGVTGVHSLRSSTVRWRFSATPSKQKTGKQP